MNVKSSGLAPQLGLALHTQLPLAKQSTWHFLWRLMWPYRAPIGLGLLAMVLTTACMMLIPQYLKHIFDEAIAQQDLAALNQIILNGVLVVGVLIMGVFARSFLIQYTGSRMINEFRQRIFAKTLDLDMYFFEDRGSGEILSRLLSDTSIAREFLQSSLPMLLRGVLLGVGSLMALFFTNWQLTLLLSLIALPVLGLGFVLGQKWRKYSKLIQENFARISRRVEGAVYGIRTIRAFHGGEFEKERVNTIMAEQLKTAKTFLLTNAAFLSFNIFMAFLGVMAVIWLGGKNVIDGTFTLGAMMSYILYLAFMGDALSNLAQFYPALQRTLGSLDRVVELLQETPTILPPATPQALPPAHNGREITLQSLHFAYPSRPDLPILRGIDATIKAGETVAFVGPSGAGKSTLFSQILRFYDPTSGMITLSGVPLPDIAFQELYANIAVVPQDATMFSATVRENVAYAHDYTAEDLEKALKLANIYDFVQNLPQGLDTEVGEKGVKLSGGQKQRLTLARALIKNPTVLLLDEATSHLDAESEQLVQQALDQARQNRTTLIIAHRLATVQSADRIFVLENGRIVAQGQHQDLIQTSDLYRKLAALQFLAPTA